MDKYTLVEWLSLALVVFGAGLIIIALGIVVIAGPGGLAQAGGSEKMLVGVATLAGIFR